MAGKAAGSEWRKGVQSAGFVKTNPGGFENRSDVPNLCGKTSASVFSNIFKGGYGKNKKEEFRSSKKVYLMESYCQNRVDEFVF